MQDKNNNYFNQILGAISTIIEVTGQDDNSYDRNQKARDILAILESLLAYAIYNTCISPETIRDSCEESYVNIKKQALMMFNKYQTHDQS